MLCGGSIELLLDYMDPANQGALSAWHAALQAMQTKKRAWMITDVSAGADAEPGILCCADAQGCASGALQPGAALVQQLQKNAGARSPLIIETEKKRYFTEPLAGLQHLYMFGSGHIAQQLAMLSVLAGFKTSVVDDRRDYATRRRFPLADEILLLDSYDEPFADIATDDNSYIVILTRNPSLDKQVLSTALHSGAAYIGMVGSEVKCRAICEELVHEGASPEALSRIHAPIGLSIGAETPEEVAISIAAELIQQRSLHTNSTIH
jgi:xanthine dehydrogenase accessory factor